MDNKDTAKGGRNGEGGREEKKAIDKIGVTVREIEIRKEEKRRQNEIKMDRKRTINVKKRQI